MIYPVDSAIQCLNNQGLLHKLFVLFIQTWIHSKPNAIIDNKLQEKRSYYPPAELVGKIVKNHPLQEPIRLQDVENSAHSQTVKKWKVIFIYFFVS